MSNAFKALGVGSCVQWKCIASDISYFTLDGTLWGMQRPSQRTDETTEMKSLGLG